jgi:hypothetical protein
VLFFTVTFAFEITPPLASVTDPTIVPVVPTASAFTARRKQQASPETKEKRFFITPSNQKKQEFPRPLGQTLPGSPSKKQATVPEEGKPRLEMELVKKKAVRKKSDKGQA